MIRHDVSEKYLTSVRDGEASKAWLKHRDWNTVTEMMLTAFSVNTQQRIYAMEHR